jgi:hypothetical protein
MKRIFTNKGLGISTKITSLVDGKKYIISTAKLPDGGWQLAVFRNIFGISNPFKPLMFYVSQTFEEAEKKHFETEQLVADFSREEWQKWSFGNGHENAAHSDNATDYLKQSEQSEQEAKEAIKRIWSRFEGKQNNTNVLKEKASILARVLLEIASQHTGGFAELGGVGKDKSSSTQNQIINSIELFIEITSVYLSFINNFAFSVLGKEDKEIFIDTLNDELTASALAKYYKEKAHLMKDGFLSNLNRRLEAYAPLPFYIGPTKENESGKHTVLWTFANNVGKMIGSEKPALFNTIIIHTMLKDIVTLQLNTLLEKSVL